MTEQKIPFATEDVVKHLEFIQTIIARMASNSFVVKGWSITLVTVLFAVGSQKSSPSLLWLALLPALGFWMLDTCFLHWERRFRHLYDYVRSATEAELQEIGPFCLDSCCAPLPERSWISAMIAPTSGVFHGAIVIVAVAVALINI